MIQKGEATIFEKSVPQRRAIRFPATEGLPSSKDGLPAEHRRAAPAALPEASELDVVRHYTRLSQLNFSIDTHFYPLGSCTMKYNPKINDQIALGPRFSKLHPLQPDETAQGILEALFRLERALCELCGMDAFTLQPSAGAQGEFVGVLVARAYHQKRGENRTEILIPDSAHGTNPASASLGALTPISVRSNVRGRLDVADFKSRLSPKTALVMLTVPNTLGLFEDDILEIAEAAHRAGALLYMDGANFNALAGLVKPGDLGVDMAHLNLHKTFSTPHGGGGPGAGPLGVKKHLEDFLPVPRVVEEAGLYRLRGDFPLSVGRVRAFFGNVGVLVRAYCYLRRHSAKEFRQISESAILHANYLKALLKPAFEAFVDEPCMHECILQTDPKRMNGVRTMDVAKRLLEYGFYAPTVYFPLIVPEAMMLEPTETESKQSLDEFARAMLAIAEEARMTPERVKAAPQSLPVKRLDEVGAARNPDLSWPGRVPSA
ncbi:MAG: aminomethyl-transferring glycine dehydrogenase subunit GcvPB [Elusimicrobia bacterium]|nr:aminomethyl-transferring glycine dehydrogenase subunit GcvPB [Elusimicrobiota bacterium]